MANEAAVRLVDGKLLGERIGERRLDLGRRRAKPRDDAVELERQAERIGDAGERKRERARRGDGIANGAEIAGAPTLERKPRQRPRQIGRCLQLIAQLAPEPGIAGEIADRVEPRIDGGCVGQRARQPPRQLARAGAGHGPVDTSEQASLPRALIGANKLEARARGRVNEQEGPLQLLPRLADRRQPADLGELHIGEEPAKGGKLPLGEFADAVEGGNAEASLERALAAAGFEMGARDRRQRGAGFPHDRAQHSVSGLIVADQNLARGEPRKIAAKIGFAQGRGQKLAGRDVERGKGETAPAALAGRAENGGEEIVRARVKQALLGERTGGDEAHHVALHHRLRPALPGFRRVLGLLADGDAVPQRDQPLEIVVSRMHRHPAHGDILAEMLAALGERDAQRARGNGGVLEEQLVEIAHAVEEQAVGIGRFDLKVLGDHRRGRRRLRLWRSVQRGLPAAPERRRYGLFRHLFAQSCSLENSGPRPASGRQYAMPPPAWRAA